MVEAAQKYEIAKPVETEYKGLARAKPTLQTQSFLYFDSEKHSKRDYLLPLVMYVTQKSAKRQVTLRLSQQEYRILERIARAYGISVTTLITRFIFSNLIQKTLEIPIQNLEKMLEEDQDEQNL